MGFWIAPHLFGLLTAQPTLDLLLGPDIVLADPGVKAYTNENERLTHCSIYYGKRSNQGIGGSDWANVTVAINGETFSAAYYGNAEIDRKDKKIETEWMPADATSRAPDPVLPYVDEGVTNGMALALAIRWTEFHAHAPVIFTFTTDLRHHEWRVGTVLLCQFAEWQTPLGEVRTEQCRIVKRTDDGMGTIKFECQSMGVETTNANGQLVRRRFAFIAPDHVAATYDTATMADRAYCYLADANGLLGSGDNAGMIYS